MGIKQLFNDNLRKLSNEYEGVSVMIIQCEKMQKYAKNRKSRLPWQRGCISKKYMHFCSSLDKS